MREEHHNKSAILSLDSNLYDMYTNSISFPKIVKNCNSKINYVCSQPDFEFPEMSNLIVNGQGGLINSRESRGDLPINSRGNRGDSSEKILMSHSSRHSSQKHKESDRELSSLICNIDTTPKESVKLPATHKGEQDQGHLESEHLITARNGEFKPKYANIDDILRIELRNINSIVEKDFTFPNSGSSREEIGEGCETGGNGDIGMEGPSVHCEENLDQGGQSNTSPHTSSRSSPQPLAAVHKTTTRYKSEMNFKRYHIPKDSEVEPTPRWKDQRDTLTIFQDLLLKINQTIPPDLVQLYSDLISYDVRISTYDQNSGMSFLKSDLDRYIKQYKKQKLSRKEQDQVGKCEELLSTMQNPSVEQKGMFGLSKEGEGQESTSNLHTVNIDPLSTNTDCVCACQEVSKEELSTSDYDFQCLCNNDICTNTTENDVSVNSISSQLAASNTLDHSKDRMLKMVLEVQNVPGLSPGNRSFLTRVQRKLLTSYNINRKQQKYLTKLYSSLPSESSKMLESRLVKIHHTDSIGNLPYVELLLQQKLANTSKFPIHGLVDSGSQSNICQGQYLKHLNIDFQMDIKPCRVTIQTPSQSHANICLGTITLNVYFRKYENYFVAKNVEFLVLSSEFRLKCPVILGDVFLKIHDATLTYDKSQNIRTLQLDLFDHYDAKSSVTVPCLDNIQGSTCRENINCIKKSSKAQSLQLNTAGVSPGVYRVQSRDSNINFLHSEIIIDNSRINEIYNDSVQHYWPIHTQSVDIPVINNYDSYNKYSIKINLIRAERLVDGQKQMWDPSGYDGRSQLSHSPPSEGGEKSDHQCDHILHLPYCQKCINHCSGSASSACPCPRKQTCVNNVQSSVMHQSHHLETMWVYWHYSVMT